MADDRLRVLIIGGYGIFGGRLAQLLADEPRLELMIAGRSGPSAAAFCANLPAKATLVPLVFDREGDLEAEIEAAAPSIIVDASGPFQAYGADPYRLVKAALARKVNYLDLADGSRFVAGMAPFDAAAKLNGVFALSGVSSFPVLTAAVVRRLALGLERVDTIAGGIAPSPFAGVGLNVIRAISSYAGKALSLTRGGHEAVGFGLTETRRFTISPPGLLPLRNTLFSLVDVPDLTVIPPLWPGLRSIWMGAGPVPEPLHRILIGLAWLVRLKLLPSLSFLAPAFHRAINILRWGEHRGGMFVQIEGVKTGGTRIVRSWHMLAEGNDGPLIPSMAIEAIVRKCLAGTPPPAGARPATAELELADYEALFSRRTIVAGIREDDLDNSSKPLFQRLLGTAFEQLPEPIGDMHCVDGLLETEGTADVEQGPGILARLIGRAFGFPPAGRNVAVTVRMSCDGRREIWTRTFAGRPFHSILTEGIGRSERLLCETFGPVAFAIALVANEDRLSYVVRRWSLFGLPLPPMLAPFGDSYEYVEGGRFHFNVEIKLPVLGQMVRYRGNLVRSQPRP